MVGEPHGALAEQEGYAGATVAAAALMTLFFPIISLIVALFLLGRERNPSKKSSLRTWAVATAVWLVLWILIGIGLVVAVGSGSESEPIQIP